VPLLRRVDQAFHIGEIGEMGVGALLRLYIGPVGLRGAHDDFRPCPHPFVRDGSEEIDLRLVDVAAKLRVDTPYPPITGQLQGEIAPGLLRHAPPKAAPLLRRGQRPLRSPAAEEAEEGVEPIIPIMVSGDGVEIGRRIGPGDTARRHVEGGDELVGIIVARGGGIHLVTTHDEQPPARKRRDGARGLEVRRS